MTPARPFASVVASEASSIMCVTLASFRQGIVAPSTTTTEGPPTHDLPPSATRALRPPPRRDAEQASCDGESWDERAQAIVAETDAIEDPLQRMMERRSRNAALYAEMAQEARSGELTAAEEDVEEAEALTVVAEAGLCLARARGDVDRQREARRVTYRAQRVLHTLVRAARPCSRAQTPRPEPVRRVPRARERRCATRGRMHKCSRTSGVDPPDDSGEGAPPSRRPAGVAS